MCPWSPSLMGRCFVLGDSYSRNPALSANSKFSHGSLMHARKALCARFQFDRAPRLLILAALALSFALCASSPLHAQNSVTFTPPANVSNDSSGFAPQVLVDLAGNIYIGYLD